MDAATIHLAHDWLVGMRGGERVLDRLARITGPTTIYTLVNDGRPLSDAIDSCEVVSSFLQSMPGAAGRLRRWYLPMMMRAVESLEVHVDCDLLISTSSAVMKSIRPPDGVAHLCYCHSPARYVWDQADDYAIGARGRLRSIGLRAVRERFRDWDRRTCDRVSRFIANSRHTARRIERFYGREAKVIHPPVRTEFFTPDDSVEREAWYLIVGALEPYKRVDLAIRAARRLNAPLKVAGSGSQQRALERMIGRDDRVELLGRVDDETLRDLYRRARGLIHPQCEDFGIIAVEAQACGCPVIALAEGGAVETVQSSTGVHFDEQSEAALAEALREFERCDFDSQACRRNALRFSESRFDEAMKREMRAMLGSSAPLIEVMPAPAVPVEVAHRRGE